jgi:hypothetical protein
MHVGVKPGTGESVTVRDEWYIPDTPRQRTTSVAEHEVLLSFNDDSDAERFENWWRGHGKHYWLEWIRNQPTLNEEST